MSESESISPIVWSTSSSTGDCDPLSILDFRELILDCGESELLVNLAIAHMSLGHCFETHLSKDSGKFSFTIES